MPARGKRLRALALYPELMNIYADRGNLQYLQQRCKWRQIEFELATATVGEQFNANNYDLIYIGGGQDRDQRLCAEDLVKTKLDNVLEAVEQSTVLLAVCGGYQLLGSYYELGSERIEGLGLAEFHTVQEGSERLIGEIAIEVDISGEQHRLVGFENHAGRTYLKDQNIALGKVISGNGNNGVDGTEGVRFGKVFGTYLHGPLLPKNVWFADYLIQEALGLSSLINLDDQLESRVHQKALARLGLTTS